MTEEVAVDQARFKEGENGIVIEPSKGLVWMKYDTYQLSNKWMSWVQVRDYAEELNKKNMQVIYNVTVSVDTEVSEEWLNWMKDVHIPDVMDTGLFLESKISKVLGHEEGGKTFAVQYLCENMETYDNYQEKFAPALQKDHTEKYGKQTVAFRTLLHVHKSFEK